MSQISQKNLASENLYFRASFLDEYHQSELRESLDPNIYSKLLDITKKGFECSWQDFWTYGLTGEKNDYHGFRDFQELRVYLTEIESKYKRYFSIEDSVLKARFSSPHQKVLTEEVGIAGALSLISYLYDLTQADWHLIPEKANIKTLDFWRNITHLASDSNQIIEVEAKGTFISEENRHLSRNNIKKHEKSILGKKAIQRNLNPRDVFYGVITSYSTEPDLPTECLILDPPSRLSSEISPGKVKILSRLNFYLDYLNLISRSNYLVALATRASAIVAIENYLELDSQPLKNRNGETFRISENYSAALTSSNYNNRNAFGEVRPIDTGQAGNVAFFFFGMDLSIPRKMVAQNFLEINSYRCEFPPSFQLSLTAKISLRDLEAFRVDYSEFDLTANGRRAILPLAGELNCNSSGLIWGRLQISQ
jgi:hypothetical protein